MGVVYTSPDKCRRCYHCVRECPVKAIRVKGGQAEVIDDLCISCGTCIRVCHQQAKEYRDDVARTWQVLAEDQPVVAILAPSFVASFVDHHPEQVVSGIRKLGFDRVVEVAYGAELVAGEYVRFLREVEEKQAQGKEVDVKTPFVASPCPALVNLIEMHYPKLIPHLVPIVSPMVALGRYLHLEAELRGTPIPVVVFVGPCVTKKAEALDEVGDEAIDIVLTFRELREMLEARNVFLEDLESSDFDAPHPRMARIFPVSGGLLKAAAIETDVMNSDVLIAEGKHVLDVLNTLEKGKVSYRFIDLLFCEGCIDGPIIDSDLPLMERRERVVSYTRERVRDAHENSEPDPSERIPGLDLRRYYRPRGYGMPTPRSDELECILGRMGKSNPEDELNCGACGYPTCRDKAVAVYRNLAEPEMCLPYMVDQLEEALKQLEFSYRELHQTHDQLQLTQEELVQAEKLSSLGQLSAGVAHELNNPLGGILLYADLIREENVPPEVEEHVNTIGREAARCRDIVSGLLNFARQARVQKEMVDINSYVSDVVADFSRNVPIGIEVTMNLDPRMTEPGEMDIGQMRRVLFNLLGNAVDAVGDAGTVEVATRYRSEIDTIEITIKDDGVGISEANKAKLFTPFFTTKEPGKGTGLGMPIAYGIVKMHRGQIEVRSEEGEGTEIIISFPRRGLLDQMELLGESHSMNGMGIREDSIR